MSLVARFGGQFVIVFSISVTGAVHVGVSQGVACSGRVVVLVVPVDLLAHRGGQCQDADNLVGTVVRQAKRVVISLVGAEDENVNISPRPLA